MTKCYISTDLCKHFTVYHFILPFVTKYFCLYCVKPVYLLSKQNEMNTETPTTIGEIMHKPLSRAADYAGTLGFSRGSLNLILHYAKLNDVNRIEELAHSALEEIENVFIKHQVQ